MDRNEPLVSVDPLGKAWPLPDASTMDERFAYLATLAEKHRALGQEIVVVQGLGFVGAAVAAALAGSRDPQGNGHFFVIGLDLPSAVGWWKICWINQGRNPIQSPDPQFSQLVSAYGGTSLHASADPRIMGLADVVIIDVPLDVEDRTDEEIRLVLEPFKQAVRTVGQHMRVDSLVVVETTVPAGTTEKIVQPILVEERATRGIQETPLLAHAFERVMPGPQHISSINQFWRSFAGIDEVSSQRARAFLNRFVDTDQWPLTEMDDPAANELTKLLENSYRAANIALIHEWALLAERMGLNLFQVVQNIRVRQGTHDNIRAPGFGVGGYCLTKDALLAQWGADNLYPQGPPLQMTLDGLRINYLMPLHTLDLLLELIPKEHIADKKVVLCGVAYLPNVGDTRNSPAHLFVEALEKLGVRPTIHDPVVHHWPENPTYPISSDLETCLQDADAVVLAVGHRDYGDLYDTLSALSSKPAIVDGQNIVTDADAETLHQQGFALIGVGKGHWRKRGYDKP